MRLLLNASVVAVLLAACQAKAPEPTATPETDRGTAATAVAPAPVPASGLLSDKAPASIDAQQGAPGTPGGLPDDRTPLSEGPIDSKSAQGAGQVLQTYAGLLEQKKFGKAWALWADGGRVSGQTRDQFAAAYAKYAAIHGEVGRPGPADGAAGSIYVEVPFRLYGTLNSGGAFNQVGTVTLKRVNDVDGSTAEQRRWHIARSDLKSHP